MVIKNNLTGNCCVILWLRWMIILSLKWFIVIFKNMQRCLFYIVISRWIQNNKVFKAVSVLNETRYGAVSGSKMARYLFSLSFCLRFLSSCRYVMSSCLLAMSSSLFAVGFGLDSGLISGLDSGLWTPCAITYELWSFVVSFCSVYFFTGIRFFRLLLVPDPCT